MSLFRKEWPESVTTANVQSKTEWAVVQHGHWIDDSTTGLFYCSHCNDPMARNSYPYCPWCGAMMDEVVE